MKDTLIILLALGIFNIYSIIKDLELYMIGENIIITNLNITIIFFIIIFFYIIFNFMISNKDKYIGIDRRQSIEIILILGLGLLGLVMLTISNEMFIIFLVLELYSISSYLLVLSRYNKEISKYSIIYFLLGNISSCLILTGLLLIYFTYGTLNLSNIINMSLSFDSPLIYSTVGWIIIIIGILFKLGLFPFSYWLLRVYPLIDTKILTYLITIPKIIYFYILFNFTMFPLIEYVNNNNTLLLLFKTYIIILFFSSIGSIVIGTFLPFNYNKFKYLLSFSSILNGGFILLFIILNIFQTNEILISFKRLNDVDYDIYNLISISEYYSLSFYTYIFIYTINTINIFFILNKISNLLLEKFNSNFLTALYQNKFLFFSLIISFFSILGIPPLAGFFPKLFLIFSLCISTSKILTYLIFLVILSSLISSLIYLFFILNTIYPSNQVPRNNINIISPNTYIISFLTIFITLFPLILPFISPVLLFILA